MNQKPPSLERKANTPVAKEKSDPSKELNLRQREVFGKETTEIIGGLDAVESPETGAETTGEISEKLKENNKSAPAGQIPVTGTATAIAIAAKKLIIPSVELMQKQVASAVKKQIRILEIKAKSLSSVRASGFEPFTLTSIVSKIRELKEILARLTHVTFETLKGWWLKYVGLN